MTASTHGGARASLAIKLVVPTSARYVVRIEGAEFEVGDQFDAKTVARLARARDRSATPG